MGETKYRLSAGLIGAFFLFGAGLTSLTQAADPKPTAEQLRLFQQLSPARQQELLRSLQRDKSALKKATPPAFPQVVRPKVNSQQSSIEKEARKASSGPSRQGGKASSKAFQPLRQFGYDLFAGVPTTFAPATDIPIPANYVIGPGDTVIVQMFGKDNIEHKLAVSRDGTLPFPRIGPIPVVGLKFSQLQKLLDTRVKKQFIGINVSITLGKLRSIRIFVLGDVERPGSYTVSGLSTLTNALFLSGGIKKIGTLRNIQLKRRGKIVSRMDLYDLLLSGDTRRDVRLLPGDVIFIPPIGKTVGIGGEVRRPAIYELKKEKTVEDLIKLGGGLLPTAFPEKVQIERIRNNRQRILLDINLGEENGRTRILKDGDIVRVYSVLDVMERVVILAGHVQRPGGYQWTSGMRLTDLIPSMLDLKPEVDARYVLVKRENPNNRTVEIISTDLVAAMDDTESTANLYLDARDTVYIFSVYDNRRATIGPLLAQLRAQTSHKESYKEVVVSGTVHHGGSYPLTPNMRVSDLLNAAGGPTDAAYTLEAELSRFHVTKGKIRKQEQIIVDLAGVLKNDADKNIELTPYDRLVVRRIPKWEEGGYIELVGEFTFPGRLPIKRGESLADVLKRAGGLTEEAYLRGAVYLRASVRAREQKYLNRLADQLEVDIVLASAKGEEAGIEKKMAMAEARSVLAQLRSTKATGRMVVQLNDLLEPKEKSGSDIRVQPGDKLFIPQRPDVVTVLGEVYYPTSHLFNSKLNADDYLKRSGGLNEKANKKGVYVVHADGSVDPYKGWSKASSPIGPGDTIIVPLKVDRISSLKFAVDITQVLYNISITLATLNTLGIF
ncbi:MAG: SLBB domain-containing protein [Acidiferrobacterales bacterium]